MKSILIVENSLNSLVRENKDSNNKYILSGLFTEFGIKNRNDRIYTAEKFLPALNELNERINNDLGVVYGEFDHPDVFDTSLSRASHVIRKAKYIKEKNIVAGEIKLLNTYWGKEAKSIVDDDLPLFVSSRAAGVTESDGSVSLKKLFTYDIVADPGFSSAKMSMGLLNESLGYDTNNSNFRIYEMTDESKINDLFNMNKNDFVTKKQLTDYSQYLIKELASTKKEVNNAISKGNIPPKKLEKLLEYYEELNASNTQVVKYLNYLAEKIQYVVNENKDLKRTTKKLIKHNDYLAENLEKSILYSEYVAENLDKNISYSEYIAENLDKNISYSEYIAENLDKNISYSEYLAEHLDNNISYSEYLAENLENNIEYSEYIAEHLDDNINYSQYLAENLDKSIEYQGMIVEKLNSKKINESFYHDDDLEKRYFPTPADAGFEDIEDDELENNDDFIPNDIDVDYDEQNNDCEDCDDELKAFDQESQIDNDYEEDDSYNYKDDSKLSNSIDKLIEEAKKRKVSETSDLNFLKFLNKSQVDSYYSLSKKDQENVKLYINEKSYFSQKDVITLISESLSTKKETTEDRVIRLMPENIKPIWEKLSELSKKSIISQVKLYPNEILLNENQIEHFWLTRNLKTNESSKKLISKDDKINEDKLSDNDISLILERFKKL